MICTVREASADDSPRLVELFGQLGYEVSRGWVADWLEHVGDEDTALVAVLEGRVVGVGVVHRTPFLNEGGYRARLTSLVVDDAVRSAGVGSALLEACERAASAMGCHVLELTTALKRDRAHAFYERQGYEYNARRYVKRVAGAPDFNLT